MRQPPAWAAPGSMVILADAHLAEPFPERSRAFVELLGRMARPPRPERLYILGDLFDVWLGGPSLRDPAHRPVIAALRALAEAGVAVTVLQGNRDFLLDGNFAAAASAMVVEEGLSLRLGQRRGYLCHGDRLLSADRAHQRMRWLLRNALSRALIGVLPDFALRMGARWLRQKSIQAGAERRGREPSDPFRPAALARLFRGGYDIAIAGHVHEERRRSLEVDGRQAFFYTLGAWGEEGSLLVFDGAELRFERFPPAPEAVRLPEECSSASS